MENSINEPPEIQFFKFP